MRNHLLIAFATLCFMLSAQAVDRPPQFVHLAFDGSKSHTMWQLTRDFAAQNNVRFTYFISGVYFLANSDRNNYVEPSKGKGKSAIGFGGSKADIQSRLEHVRLAIKEGHEIASHANGHYDGSGYSQSQWNSELQQFNNFMTQSWDKYGVGHKEPQWWTEYFRNNMIGFRAPLLGKSNGMWPALVANGYAYDTSRIDKMNYWPKVRDGVWNFPLASVRVHGLGKNTISMDYNFYVVQSKGKPGPESMYKTYEEQMFHTYMAYFKNNYYGNRAPIHIGHHFSRWNGGAYWKAMQRFAKAICNQPEVICGTYTELVEFLSQRDTSTISEYQKGNFPKAKQIMAKTANAFGSSSLSFSLETLAYDVNVSDEEVEGLRQQQHDHFMAHDE